mgnify:CR=1 FL=1
MRNNEARQNEKIINHPTKQHTRYMNTTYKPTPIQDNETHVISSIIASSLLCPEEERERKKEASLRAIYQFLLRSGTKKKMLMTTSSQSLHYMIFSLSVCIICIIHNYVNNLHLCVVSIKRARKKKMTEGGKRKTTSKQNRLFLSFFPLSLVVIVICCPFFKN